HVAACCRPCRGDRRRQGRKSSHHPAVDGVERAAAGTVEHDEQMAVDRTWRVGKFRLGADVRGLGLYSNGYEVRKRHGADWCEKRDVRLLACDGSTRDPVLDTEFHERAEGARKLSLKTPEFDACATCLFKLLECRLEFFPRLSHVIRRTGLRWGDDRRWYGDRPNS